MSQQGMGLIAEAEAEAGRSSSIDAERPEVEPSAGGRSPSVSVAPRARVAGPGGWRAVANAVCVPLAAAAALAIHRGLPDRGPVVRTSAYATLLITILVLGVLAIGLRWVSPRVHRWV